MGLGLLALSEAGRESVADVERRDVVDEVAHGVRVGIVHVGSLFVVGKVRVSNVVRMQLSTSSFGLRVLEDLVGVALVGSYRLSNAKDLFVLALGWRRWFVPVHVQAPTAR